ncbi:MAG: carboxypeptidase regulatory-like domain-containing protein, partial [Bacteroidales bacterium]
MKHCSSRKIQNVFYLKKVASTVLTFFFFFVTISAQRPTAYGGEERSSIAGKVVDASSNEPIEFAIIAVLRSRDSSAVGVGSTTSDGSFAVQNIPPGRYRVKISFVGYKNHVVDSVRLM